MNGNAFVIPNALSIRPIYTRRVREALHALAESNPTPAEYRARKEEILALNE
jgi:hypothetical protein